MTIRLDHARKCVLILGVVRFVALPFLSKLLHLSKLLWHAVRCMLIVFWICGAHAHGFAFAPTRARCMLMVPGFVSTSVNTTLYTTMQKPRARYDTPITTIVAAFTRTTANAQ